jgi:hypothetical protein
VRVPESKQEVLNALAAAPYSSVVNTAVAATLGDLGESWRQFRAARIQEAVRSWAESRGIPLNQIIGQPSPTTYAATEEVVRHDFSAVSPQDSPAIEQRRRLHALIDSLEPADVSQILFPASVLFKLTSSRGQ